MAQAYGSDGEGASRTRALEDGRFKAKLQWDWGASPGYSNTIQLDYNPIEFAEGVVMAGHNR